MGSRLNQRGEITIRAAASLHAHSVKAELVSVELSDRGMNLHVSIVYKRTPKTDDENVIKAQEEILSDLIKLVYKISNVTCPTIHINGTYK